MSDVESCRTCWSPVKTPALVAAVPSEPVVDVTVDLVRMVLRIVLTLDTRVFAAFEAVDVVRATLIVTGEASTAETVRSTPGMTPVKVFVFDVICCAAPVPPTG